MTPLELSKSIYKNNSNINNINKLLTPTQPRTRRTLPQRPQRPEQSPLQEPIASISRRKLPQIPLQLPRHRPLLLPNNESPIHNGGYKNKKKLNSNRQLHKTHKYKST